MWEALQTAFKDLIVGIYYAILGGRDHSLKASFEKEYRLLSGNHTGFVLGDKRLSLDRSYKNLGIISPTGGGKTTTHLYPHLLSMEGKSSAIVNDPSQELQKTIPYLLSRGIGVHVFKPGDQHTSIGFNPLSMIRNVGDIGKLASLVTTISQKKERGSFWASSSSDLIANTIQFVYESLPRQYCHLGQVYQLIEELQANENVVSRLYAEKGSEVIWRKHSALLSTNDDTKASIIASARSYLGFLANPVVADQLSYNSLDMSVFRHTPTVLFMTCQPLDIPVYRPLFSLWFELFFRDHLKALPEESDKDIWIMLDEMTTSLSLPNLPNIISVNRKFRLPISYCIQSESQLYSTYSKEDAVTILNNTNTKVYFGGLEVAEESGRLEKTLGQFEYKDEEGKLKKRQLMTADEIRCLKPFETIIVSTATKPVKTKLVPHFKQRKCIEKMAIELPDGYEPSSVYQKAHYVDLEPYREPKNKD